MGAHDLTVVRGVWQGAKYHSARRLPCLAISGAVQLAHSSAAASSQRGHAAHSLAIGHSHQLWRACGRQKPLRQQLGHARREPLPHADLSMTSCEAIQCAEFLFQGWLSAGHLPTMCKV